MRTYLQELPLGVQCAGFRPRETDVQGRAVDAVAPVLHPAGPLPVHRDGPDRDLARVQDEGRRAVRLKFHIFVFRFHAKRNIKGKEHPGIGIGRRRS